MRDEYEERSEEEIVAQRKKSEKRKKILAAAVLCVAGVFALFGILLLILSGASRCTKEQAKTQLEDELRRSYNYVDPDYELNIFEDEGYLAKDREIWFNDGVVKTIITDSNLGNYAPEIQFMYNVVNLIIKGDYVAYNKIFTENYLQNAGDDLRERFTMQQLFQIELQYVNRWQEGSTVFSDIMLTYRIRNNNGTFRNDLDYNDEGTIPVIYRLSTDAEGTIQASNMLTYSKYYSGLYE